MAEGPAELLQSDGLQPGHDIFCTPHNDAFHATTLYSALDAAQQEIRLVRLWPGTGDDVIECTLLPGAPLRDLKGQYTAPSYCAGSAKNTEPIILNGTPFNVFANLAHALREVRHFWSTTYGDRECLLWIDQISINQYDINERSRQVRFMRDIYQCAEQVLVCLSTEEADPRGMYWLNQLAKDVRPRDIDTVSKKISMSLYDEADDEQRAKMIEIDHRHRIEEHFRRSLSNVDFIEGWLASYEIIEAPWFARAWVLQEFIVAANVYFMYSGASASWKVFLPVWRVMSSTYLSRLDRNIHRLIWDVRHSGLPQRQDLQKVLVNIRGGDLKRRMAEAIFTIDSKAHSRHNQDLKELLAHSRHRNTSDPRDKIFAYIGLANPAYGIVPDYSHPIDRVLLDTTVKIIETENSLDILWHAAASETQHTASLPSWVVDWRCKQDPYAPAKPYTSSLEKAEANVSFHTIATARGISQALQVDGVFIARLDEDTRRMILNPPYLYSCSRDIRGACSRHSRRGDEMWVLRGCNLPLILRFQEEHAYTLVSAADYGRASPECPSLESLVRHNEEKQGGWRSMYII